MRQENQNAADAGQNAVNEQAAQHACRHVGREPSSQCAYAILDEFHGPLRPAEDSLEDEEKQGSQNGVAQDGMQDEGVEAIAETGALPFILDTQVQNAAHIFLHGIGRGRRIGQARGHTRRIT